MVPYNEFIMWGFYFHVLFLFLFFSFNVAIFRMGWIHFLKSTMFALIMKSCKSKSCVSFIYVKELNFPRKQYYSFAIYN